MNFKPTLATKTIYRGDTANPIVVTFKDDTGELINITGWNVWFTVRKTPASTATTSDTDAIISKLRVGTSSGSVTFEISSTDTDISPTTYYYDVQYEKSAGIIKTVGVGEFVVMAEVTRSR